MKVKVRRYELNDFVNGALVGVIILFCLAVVALFVSGVLTLWADNPATAIGLIIVVSGILGGGFYQMRKRATTPRLGGGEEDV